MKFKVKTILNDEAYLRQISKEVDFNDKSYLKEAQLLASYCRKEKLSLAFAAVQIGIPKRIIYVKKSSLDKSYDPDWDEKKVLINLVIINKVGMTKYWEACASCLDYMGLVSRPYEIEIEYYDIDGNKIKEKFSGFMATVLSHEYDHLNGILHIDIAEDLKIMSPEERKEFRKTHDYEIISKEGNYDELKVKNKQRRLKK